MVKSSEMVPLPPEQELHGSVVDCGGPCKKMCTIFIVVYLLVIGIAFYFPHFLVSQIAKLLRYAWYAISVQKCETKHFGRVKL